ncbi:hypothetical protein BVRB_1g016530 [Beta vulgaris subsp. vulgaris]|nr:hypothetical protein BVRB_1g016530 [Beta vulgaris subsp. vulgaris]
MSRSGCCRIASNAQATILQICSTTLPTTSYIEAYTHLDANS